MTTITKDIRNGWTAETRFDLADSKVLIVTTMKRWDKSLSTTATVQTKSVFHGVPMLTYAAGRDFSKTFLKEEVRATQQSVAKQHEAVLRHISTIKDQVAQHYGEAVTA